MSIFRRRRPDSDNQENLQGMDRDGDTKIFGRHFFADSGEPDSRQTPPRFERFNPSPERGLTSEQVRIRMSQGLDNYAPDQSSLTTREILRKNVFTYFNLIFAIVTILLLIAGCFSDLSFLPIIVLNTAIGIGQQLSAKRTLDRLNLLHAAKAVVVRDGRSRTVPADNLVLDDIVILKSGSQVCADARIIVGDVRVNEALLTGEADEIKRTVDDDLMSGSFITSGQCLAQLTAVGEDAYIHKLTKEAKAYSREPRYNMMRSLDKLLKVVGVIIIPMGLLLFYQAFVNNASGFQLSISTTVAAVIGMIPEGLYLLTSVALASSTAFLATRKVLVHDMKVIEMLARVDILCLDKTGTITENRMAVHELIPLAPSAATTSVPSAPDNSMDDDFVDVQLYPESGDNVPDSASEDMAGELSRLLGSIVQAFPPDNDTLTALKSYFREKADITVTRVIPFSSKLKYSAAEAGDNTYIFGAPEFVMRDAIAQYKEQLDRQASQGFRVLVFARTGGTITEGESIQGLVEPLAFITLTNPLRKNAAETFKYFGEQGVNIRVISGDNPVTVSRVAQEAGIPCAEQYVDASTLSSPSDIRLAAEKYTVFGRVSPSQKRELILALKDAGHTVAMTGDGVNDVLALKEADCSIAMAAGSDAASQVSQLVLLESDFSRIPTIMGEGRRVINNVERSASLFVLKNIFSLLLSIFTLLSSYPYPLKTAQITLITVFTIGAPAFLLSFEPNSRKIEGHFMSNVMRKAIPGAVTMFIVVAGMVIFSQIFGVSEQDTSTAAALLMAVVGFMILGRIMRPMNIYHIIVFALMVVGCIIVLTSPIGSIFSINAISPRCAAFFIVFAIISEPVLRYLTRLTELCNRIFHKLRRPFKKRPFMRSNS